MQNPTIATVHRAADAHRRTPGGLLPALHAVQDAIGHVPAEAVGILATTFNLSRAEVHGVLTYYHHFRSTPPGRHVVQVCRAEACRACGAETLMAHVEHCLGCRHGETRSDGTFTVEPVYCLGLCASAPAIRIDEQLHARVTPERFDRWVSDLGGTR